MSNEMLQKVGDNMRLLTVAMTEKAKSGHPGGAMGGADFMALLYSEFLRFDPDDMSWEQRDRFFLDPGHMSPMLYSVLGLFGAYSLEDIAQFRQWGSPTPGHPERDVQRGVENTSGPLGQGHSMGLGSAIAERFMRERFGDWMAHTTYAFISDGGIEEEISQGVGRLAGHLGMGNFIMFYDANDIQLSTPTSVVTSEDTAKKYEAWGWHVETVDGHDFDQMRAALQRAKDETGRPSIIIGKTLLGKGVVDEEGTQMDPSSEIHGKPISKAGASAEKTISGLGGDPENPFAVFPEVAEYIEKVKQHKREYVAQQKQARRQWENDNPQLAGKLRAFLAGDTVTVDFSTIEQKAGAATRKASGAVLGALAAEVDNMIVASADLSDSDNTNSYLKKTQAFTKDDFSGKFLQCGVSELTMGGIMNGIAAHGGVIPVCGTFFVFSDYMKPVVRLAALMQLPVKYVWTHDAFRVGEDGPTHQPIEQEAQIRLLEKMNNHGGTRSMLVLRPADANETTVAWKMALEKNDAPAALLLSRQGIEDVPAQQGSTRYQDALQAQKGAYVAFKTGEKPDLLLVANGSEVATCIEGAKRLTEKDGLSVWVVSAISDALFADQDESYKDAVIPFGVPVLGFTAGLAVALQPLVGPMGKAIGMEEFGHSAPYTVLDEKLGYNGDNVAAQARAYLQQYDAMKKKLASVIC
jgi:transketolase